MAAVVVGVAGCGGGGGGEVVPRAGMSFGTVPLLQGQEVMLFPVQLRFGVPASVDLDSEIAFALESRSSQVDWLLPEELRAVAARNPAIDIPLDGLPVDTFLRAQVERVGDPLYGQLLRMNTITGVPLALIPVRARYRARPEIVDGITFGPAMELAAVLIQIRTGRVLWFGIVDGADGGPTDPQTLATAADALARSILP